MYAFKGPTLAKPDFRPFYPPHLPAKPTISSPYCYLLFYFFFITYCYNDTYYYFDMSFSMGIKVAS